MADSECCINLFLLRHNDQNLLHNQQTFDTPPKNKRFPYVHQEKHVKKHDRIRNVLELEM